MTAKVFITTSWDDGHPGDLRIAQLLERYGLRGTFYVPRTHESEDVIRPQRYTGFGPGIELGAHTLHHTPLTWVDDRTAQREIVDSKAWIEDVTGKPCTLFCPPRGKFHRRHLDMIAQAGYTAARTVESWSLDTPRTAGSLRVMPTTTQAFPSKATYTLRNLIKRRACRGLKRYLRHGLRHDWPTSLRACTDEALRHGGVIHLWGHAWEITQQSQWAELDLALRDLGRLCRQGRARAVTNGQLAAAFAQAPHPQKQTTTTINSDRHPPPPAKLQTT